MKRIFQLASFSIVNLLYSVSGNSQWQTVGSNIFNTNTGNVGIGITSPSVLLHLYKSSADNLIRIESGGAFYSYLSLKNSAAEWQVLNNNDGSFAVTNPSIERFHISSNGNVGIGLTSPGQKLHVAGTIKVGSYTFITEPNNGLASVFANNLYAGVSNNTLIRQQNSDPGNYISLNYDRGIIFGTGVTSAAGTEVSDNINERMRIDLSGNVGIGTNNPAAKLDVRGTPGVAQLLVQPVSTGTAIARIASNGNAHSRLDIDANYAGYIDFLSAGTSKWTIGRPSGSYDFEIYNSVLQAPSLLIKSTTGSIGIGTTNVNDANYKLFVETGIRTRKLKVDQVSWPDYVFEASYKLPSLNEVEAFIQQHKHLPGVPSAKEVVKEGLDMGENQAILLKKIEELTLYVIELKKEVDRLKMQNKPVAESSQEVELLKARFNK